MKRIALVPTFISGILIAGAVVAHAAAAPKVFVCKYVGQPGVNETLQTGQNPISVSVNAIKNYQGVGSQFNDAQGRSLVIAVDIGQDEEDLVCPTTPPQSKPPTENTPPVVTSTPTKTDLCTNIDGVQTVAPVGMVSNASNVCIVSNSPSKGQ